MATITITNQKTEITDLLQNNIVCSLQNLGKNEIIIENNFEEKNILLPTKELFLQKENNKQYYCYCLANNTAALTITKAAYQNDGGGGGGDIIAGTGLVFDGNVLNHSNNIVSGSVGGALTIPQITYDTEGHINLANEVAIPKTNDYTTADENVLFTQKGANDLYNLIVSGGDIVAGTGLVLDGNTMNHSNSVQANTNNTLKTFKYDTEGHITEGTDISLSNDLQLNNNTISIKTNDNYTTEGETGIFTTQGAHALFLESSGGGGIQTYIKDTPVDINNYLASLPQDISFIATLSSDVNTGELVNLIGTASFYIIHFKTNTNEWLELAYTYPLGSLTANRTKNSYSGGITSWVVPDQAIQRQSSIVWDDRYINASSSICSLLKSFRTVNFSFQLKVSGTISEGYSIGTMPAFARPTGTNYRVIGYDSNKNILLFYITTSGNMISKQNIEVNQTIYCSGCFITSN